jgi:hypothetical protein
MPKHKHSNVKNFSSKCIHLEPEKELETEKQEDEETEEETEEEAEDEAENVSDDRRVRE